jgi:hypothetical protein
VTLAAPLETPPPLPCHTVVDVHEEALLLRGYGRQPSRLLPFPKPEPEPEPEPILEGDGEAGSGGGANGKKTKKIKKEKKEKKVKKAKK